MKVCLIEKESGKCVATYSVVLGSIGAQNTEDDYFAEAWRCALEDQLVDSTEVKKYTCSLEV